MSVWSTFDERRVKKYVASHVDPRKESGFSIVDLAVVADYVYNDNAHGEAILPYLRLGIYNTEDSVILTVKQAMWLRDQLTWFIEKGKVETK